ncbi:MAG TPA: polysaccharide biosynthesis/export family protein [Longimicrobiales bacterium]|nr:polysaccharide biosynthesis/export family protein [Longimicrobiales bacterium]
MTRLALSVVLLSGLILPTVGSAQIPVEFGPGSSQLSREELTNVLAQLEEAIRSPAYSGRVKAVARTSAERVRDRLENGDFHVGDQVVLSVQGEPTLPAQVVVEPGPQITLPLFGAIPLAGVLRSEIQAHLTRELGKVIHEPVVQARGLLRLSVQGSVGNPGFYVMPADILVSDALMQAGGPRNGDLDALRVERGSVTLVEGRAMQEALLQGRTLDQLNLQAGDQIFLPPKTAGGGVFGTVARYTLPIVISAVMWRFVFQGRGRGGF